MSGRRRFSQRPPSDARLELAEEAARLIVEHGIQDFALAKRKAAEHAFLTHEEFFADGRTISTHLMTWSRRWAEAEHALAADARARRDSIEAHLVRMRDLATVLRTRAEIGTLSPLETAGIDYAVADAEAWLLAER